jgi:hypothetical protein
MTNDETNRAAAVAGVTSPPQAADIRDRWWWVEHSVWTDRMLTRLEQSGPTTKWFRLWDKVVSERNLQAAFWAVWRNDGAPGVDGQTVKQFNEQSESELARLGDELKTKRYRRQPARRVWIPKPGTTERRPLGIPAVRDRTVEAALRQVLEPIFERDFAQSSYGFRPGRGCREAVARVEELLSQGHVWCVGRRPQELLRHHPTRSADGIGQRAHRGRQRPELAGTKPESRRDGGAERLAAD